MSPTCSQISSSLVQCFGKLFPANLISRFELFPPDKYLLGISHVEGARARQWMQKKHKALASPSSYSTWGDQPQKNLKQRRVCEAL